VEKVRREIRIITNKPLEPSVEIIRRAFGTVAEAQGITPQNAPRFTAFITPERLEETRRNNGVFWGLFVGGKQVGFVAVEKEPDGKYWMKRLAVLPEFRHGGSGKALVDTAIAYVRSRGEKTLYIAVAGDHGVLNDWYAAMGFQETSVQKFPHLPFNVAFMELEI
jgi:diamine N-acetyltransferase